MNIFKTKTPAPFITVEVVPPTLAERAAKAEGIASSALSAFTAAAVALDASAADFEAVRNDALEEADRMMRVAADAESASDMHHTQAAKIRDLIGGTN